MATDYNGRLNFIVEHVGLPRIEDFCFMATQEPNVYAGLSVVVGGLMHARPKFFAKVMGELLFWVGEDKMLFGSDYAIWEPKWQIEGFVDWEMPDEPAFADFPRLDETARSKILGLNAAKLYGVEVPAELRGDVPADEPATRGQRGGRRDEPPLPSPRALGTVYDPELDEPITTLGFVGSLRRDRRRRCVGAPAASDAAVRAELRVPDGGRRAAPRSERVPGRAVASTSCSRTTTRAPRSTPRSTRGDGFSDAFPGETRGELDALRALFQRKALVARQSRLLSRSTRRRDARRADRAGRRALPRAAARAGYRRVRRRCAGVRHRRRHAGRPRTIARFRRMASLTALSLETNGGMCRDLLRVRYSEEGVAA